MEDPEWWLDSSLRVFPDEFNVEMSVGADGAFAYCVNQYHSSVAELCKSGQVLRNKNENQEPGYILLFINADLVCPTARAASLMLSFQSSCLGLCDSSFKNNV